MKLSNKEQLQQVIEETRELLHYLENEQIEDAQALLDRLASYGRDDLFHELGKLTRSLHEALKNFQLDPRVTEIAAAEIPDAKDRLNYVIEKTEEAANKTMDKVEQCTTLADHLHKDADELLAQWQKLYRRELSPGEFRELCKRIEAHLLENKEHAESLHKSLQDVLMAQDYQDLTGQVIRQIITLVKDVEDSMVEVIRVFGHMDSYQQRKAEGSAKSGVEGPVVNKEKRDDVVNGQDEVDDLLSSLGF